MKKLRFFIILILIIPVLFPLQKSKAEEENHFNGVLVRTAVEGNGMKLQCFDTPWRYKDCWPSGSEFTFYP